MTISRITPMRWWSDRPLRIKGLIVIAVPIMVLICTLIASYQMRIQANLAQENIRHTIQTQREIQKVHTLLAEAATGVRGYLLTGYDDFLTPYRISEVELPRTLLRLRSEIRDPQQRDLLHEVSRLAEKKSEGLAELLRMGPAASADRKVQALVLNKKVLDDLRARIEAMLLREGQLQRDSVQRANEVQDLAMMATVAASIAGVLGALFASLLFSAGIVRRVQQLSDNAGRLELGQELSPVDAANDELGQLSNRLARASNLLAVRADEVKKAQQEAEQANQFKTEFLSRTSHELRTPLNAVLGFAQLLQKDIHAVDAQQSVTQILKGGRHLLALIDEVLDIARIEAGQLALSLQAVNLTELLGEAMALIAPLAQDKNVHLAAAPDSTGIYLLADRKRLLQVLLNLLSNAVKYNREQGTVSLSILHGDSHVRLYVMDNGAGIAAELQDRLFTPFDRLGAERKLVEGHGLGLVVSKQLTKAMGGEIGLSSVVGQGSSFWIEIPVAQAIEPPAGFPSVTPLGAVQRACTILYIEDNSSNLVLVEMLLARYPHITLISATKGGEGLQQAQQHMPDLILLDLQLPDMSGQDVLQQVRASPALAHIPVVILSANALSATIERLQDAGANAYLTKPLDVKLFFSTLNRFLS